MTCILLPILDYTPHSAYFHIMNLEQATALIANRRSIKPIDMDPAKNISQETWNAMMESANWAPSHGHNEPWRFIIYRGDSRAEIAKALQNAYKADTPEQDFKPEKHEKMGKKPLYVHAVAAIVMSPGDNEKIPEIEEIEAVACAVQNMHLAATAAGVGLFWSSPAVSYGANFAQSLDLGKSDKCLGLLYIGYPKEGHKWPKSSRKPVADKITWK